MQDKKKESTTNHKSTPETKKDEQPNHLWQERHARCDGKSKTNDNVKAATKGGQRRGGRGEEAEERRQQEAERKKTNLEVSGKK